MFPVCALCAPAAPPFAQMAKAGNTKLGGEKRGLQAFKNISRHHVINHVSISLNTILVQKRGLLQNTCCIVVRISAQIEAFAYSTDIQQSA